MEGIIPTPLIMKIKLEQQRDTHLILTLLAPRVLVPTPSTRGGGGIEMDHPKYLKNDKHCKSETLGAVKGILQGLKKFKVDITAFAC